MLHIVYRKVIDYKNMLCNDSCTTFIYSCFKYFVVNKFVIIFRIFLFQNNNMASTSVGVTRCPVCFDNYNEPYMLMCKHTFCRSCLGGFTTNFGFVICPECQHPTNLMETGVYHLPANSLLALLQTWLRRPKKYN